MIAATQSNHPLAAISGRDTVALCLDEACNRIRTAGMRVTKPRIALIEALLRQEGPVSIERIHHEVGVRSCDLVTIYRCLAAFENLGLVRRSYLHNGTCLYEQTINTARRYHIICKACGRTDRVDYTLAGDIEQRLHEKGYAQISHVVEFFGVCPACQQTAKAARQTTAKMPVV
ncbi:MAG: Fur family transcriptional regulator [Verrucomicrobiota bacterium]